MTAMSAPRNTASSTLWVTSTKGVPRWRQESSRAAGVFRGDEVEAGEGFVHEQQLGPRGEGPGDGHALLLAAGQARRIVALAPGQPHFGQHGPGPGLALGRGTPGR
jgi:hypothetical protein